MSLANSIAIVTGSGRGIGRAIAEGLAKGGARLVLTARTASELRETAQLLAAAGAPVPALTLAGDIASESFIAELFKLCQSQFGAPTILVNNAATLYVAPFKSMDRGKWDETLAVNLTAPFLCSQAFFNIKVPAGTPRAIINISSLGGLMNTAKFPGLSAYVTSKFGIVGLTEALAVEGKPLGIRVNCIAPGAVDTAMLRKAAPQLKTSTGPADVAGTACFLADASQSGALTGTTIAIHSNE